MERDEQLRERERAAYNFFIESFFDCSVQYTSTTTKGVGESEWEIFYWPLEKGGGGEKKQAQTYAILRVRSQKTKIAFIISQTT